MHSMLECPCTHIIPKNVLLFVYLRYLFISLSMHYGLDSSLDRVKKKDKAINKYKRSTDERPERRKIGRKEVERTKNVLRMTFYNF